MAAGLITFNTGIARAVDQHDMEIVSVETREVTLTESQELSIFGNAPMPEHTDCPTSGLQTQDASPSPGVIWDEITRIGRELWKIVVDNQPEVNARFQSASALPRGVTCWDVMDTWAAPSAKTFQVSMKNGWGVEVINFVYRIVYTYGGSYQGRGQYLSSVKVIPANLNVAWGFKINVNASIPQVFNGGTAADPIANMEVVVDWTVRNPITFIQRSSVYHVSGDGAFRIVE